MINIGVGIFSLSVRNLFAFNDSEKLFELVPFYILKAMN
jgi:hypothetical protein